MRHAVHRRLPSVHLGRPVHLWSFGWYGPPLLVFPSAAGMAHEWQMSGAVEALAPLIEAGRLKLYCPETNVSEAWTSDADPRWRLARHEAYERFVTDELVPFIRADCRSPDIPVATAGCSFGGFYAANFALKRPGVFHRAFCFSGRYHTAPFLEGADSLGAYYNQPLSYVPNLHGAALAHVRQNTHLTLVVGQGPWEGRCIPETLALADTLAAKGIPHERDVWGHDAAHHWDWWRRQIRYHLERWVTSP